MTTAFDAKHRRAESRWQTIAAQIQILGGLRDYADGVDQVSRLITKVRMLTDTAGYRDVQLELLDDIRSAEEHVRSARRALGHARPPYDIAVEELQISGHAQQFVAWHRRVTQLRGVGDAIAWRMLGYHRGYLGAFAVGRGSGYVVEKAGLGAELRAFEQSWSSGVPAILTAVTRCLRVGDLIELAAGTAPRVREIKSRPARRGGHGAQTARRNKAQATVTGIRQPDIPRIVSCAASIRHHLEVLRQHLPHVVSGGLDLQRLPHADLLLFDTASWFDPGNRAAWQDADQKIGARVRADPAQEWVRVQSFERVDLDDFNAPYAIYPFEPEICAALMFGYLQIWTHLNFSFVMHTLAHRGFSVISTVPMPPGAAMVLVDNHLNKLQVTHAMLGRVIYEALDPESLADLTVAVRDDSTAHLRGSPVGTREEILPAFADESRLWA